MRCPDRHSTTPQRIGYIKSEPPRCYQHPSGSNHFCNPGKEGHIMAVAIVTPIARCEIRVRTFAGVVQFHERETR